MSHCVQRQGDTNGWLSLANTPKTNLNPLSIPTIHIWQPVAWSVGVLAVIYAAESSHSGLAFELYCRHLMARPSWTKRNSLQAVSVEEFAGSAKGMGESGVDGVQQWDLLNMEMDILLPWQMLMMLLLCRCWCLLVLVRMCESGRRRNSSFPAIQRPADWILVVLHPALTAQCLLVRLLLDSLWRMLRDTEQMICGKATMVSKWGDLAVSPLRNARRNTLGHLLTEV